MPIAAREDVEAWLGRDLTEAEARQVQALLSALEARIRRTVDGFDGQLDDPDYRAEVVGIECAAVARVLRNTEGYASQSVDNVALSYRSSAASGVLELTGDEWARLGYVAGIGAIRVTPGPPGGDGIEPL